MSPIIPGCQQITTVIGPDGKPIVLNKIWRTAANLENGGPNGQRGIDMAPAAPHTRARQARSCASCHTNSKALGYGTHDGRYMTGKPNSLCRSKLGCPKDWIRTHNGAYAPLWFWFYRN